MYEHPYLAYKVTEYEQEQLQRAVDCRRFLEEHSDQIVPRAAGPVRRLGQRMLRAVRGARAGSTDAAADAVAPALAPAAAPSVSPVLAPSASSVRSSDAAADRLAPVGCEPVPAQ